MSKSVITAIKEIKQPTIAAPAGLGRKGRPGKISRDPIRHYGPRALHRYADPKLGSNFCTPWPGFVTATTSLSEQMMYAAIAIFMDDPQEYWLPPYDGGIHWRYQTFVGGGRLFKGGQVPDFEVDYNGTIMYLRLQSMRWHVMAEHAKQVEDMFNKTNAFPAYTIVRDVWEEDFVGDCSGRAAVRVITRTITIGETSSPLMFGTGRQVRKDFVG